MGPPSQCIWIPQGKKGQGRTTVFATDAVPIRCPTRSRIGLMHHKEHRRQVPLRTLPQKPWTGTRNYTRPTASPLLSQEQEESELSTALWASGWWLQGSHLRPTRPAAVLFSPVVALLRIRVGCWVIFIVRWRGSRGYGVRGVGMLWIF